MKEKNSNNENKRLWGENLVLRLWDILKANMIETCWENIGNN